MVGRYILALIHIFPKEDFSVSLVTHIFQTVLGSTKIYPETGSSYNM